MFCLVLIFNENGSPFSSKIGVFECSKCWWSPIKKVGTAWKQLSAEEKQYYEREADSTRAFLIFVVCYILFFHGVDKLYKDFATIRFLEFLFVLLAIVVTGLYNRFL